MGRSTRFPNLRPKWMLTHPTGGFMGTEALRGLNLESFSTIYFVTHKNYETEYMFIDGFVSELRKINTKCIIEFVLLEEPTRSQPETVYQCIKKMGITGPILVKDSDNYFRATIGGEGNVVCYFDLNDGDQFNARNKSYIQFDTNGLINNIVEKKIISSTFSVGGYGFESADTFCEYFKQLDHLTSEIYMSNIIFQMLLSGHKFTGIKTTDYEDWGTLEEWNKYKKSFRTLFVDLDGVLIENTSVHMRPFIGSGTPIHNNISLLQELYKKGRTKIIITTARPSESKQETELELQKNNIPYDLLIMDLPHSQRIIINDFAKSNPYPSCGAINLERNSDKLDVYL